MPTLKPVDTDPFATPKAPTLKPVATDPFKAAAPASPVADDPFFNPQAPTKPGIQKDIYDLAQQTGDTLKQFPGRVATEFKTNLDAGTQSVNDMKDAPGLLSGAKNMGKALLSDFNAIMSPITAAGQTVEDIAANVSGSKDIGERAGLLAQALVPVGGKGAMAAEDVGKIAPKLGEAARVEPRLVPVERDPFASAPPVGTAPMAPRAAPEVPPTGPKPPSDLGAAAAAPSEPLPATPPKDIITEQEDRFQRLRGNAQADKAELLQKVDAIPAEFRTPAVQEKLYRYGEGDKSVTLTPEEKSMWDQHIEPMRKELSLLATEVKKSGIDDMEELNPDYMHRMVKGKSGQFDALAGEASSANPIGGNRSLPRTTSALQDRVFFAVEDAKGMRKVVAKDGAGNLSVIENGKSTPLLRGSNEEVKPGLTFHANGKEWTLKQALTSEIEANTGTQYYKSAVGNTVDALARMRVVARAVHEVERLKASPEWAAYARPYNARNVPNDWRVPTMPLFRDWKVEPHLANVIDDFYGSAPKGKMAETLAKINNLAVGALFWQPVTHGLNAAAHWWTARGWDNFMPSGIKSLVTDGPQAMWHVMTQSPKYQQMLREGSGLIYGGVANKDFHQQLLKAVGENIIKDPKRWGPVVKAFGMNKPADLVAALYRGSAKALWAASDMFMMQRVMELERKGMTTRAAIKEAERHIPNYRVPSEVLGSRAVQQVLTNPSLTEFSRYHYGMFKSYGHMIRDTLKGSPKEKLDAAGNMFATAVLMGLVYPAANRATQQLTGNPKATLGARGSTTIPQNLIDLYNGDKNFIQVFNSIVTMAPLLKTGVEATLNTDTFTGKPIAEPSDMRKGNAAAVAGQEVEHAAQNLVPPYNMVETATKAGKGLPRAMLDQTLGIRDPSPEQDAKKRKAFEYQDTQAKSRHKRPKGMIEGLGNMLQGLN